MIKVGIIGAGRIGHVHGESISKFVKHATVKTIADPFMNEKIEAWAKSIGVEHTTKDYKEILADPEIEAVLICASTDQHSPLSIEALKAGKHVFCEKPIDHDVEKIKEVLAVVNVPKSITKIFRSKTCSTWTRSARAITPITPAALGAIRRTMT